MEVIFTKSNTLIGKLIRWGTSISWVKSAKVNHIAIRYGAEESNWVIESDLSGFVPKWWPEYISNKSNNQIYRYKILGIEEKVLEEILDECLNNLINKPYDILAFLGFIATILTYKLTGKRIKNFFGFKRAYICSESIYYILKKMQEKTGLEMIGNFNDGNTFPEELRLDLVKRTDRYKEIIGTEEK